MCFPKFAARCEGETFWCCFGVIICPLCVPYTFLTVSLQVATCAELTTRRKRDPELLTAGVEPTWGAPYPAQKFDFL